MNWMDKRTSLYTCNMDKVGESVTFRDIYFTRFAIRHKWFYKLPSTNTWMNGTSNDLYSIVQLRNLNPESENYSTEKNILKKTIQCFTISAELKERTSSEGDIISLTGLLQLDFDYADIYQFDIREIMQAVFSLPFIALCSLSVSGLGFYALALISEPERLAAYAEHIFEILEAYGVKPDRSKGRNYNDLRYVSYDSKMLIRENPEPLLIKRFKPKLGAKKMANRSGGAAKTTANSGLIKAMLTQVQQAQIGQRWGTIQRVAFTLGGKCGEEVLEMIKDEIHNNPAFNGETEKYLECAQHCFKEGQMNPLPEREWIKPQT